MDAQNPPPDKVFIATSESLLNAVDHAMRQPGKLPAFILLYSSMDIFSSITRPIDQPDTSGAVFMSWVDKYMLPHLPPRFKSMDFWGARCGLLHTSTTESRKSRAGEAREIGYADDDAAAEEFQKTDPTCQEHVVIGIPCLMRAFTKAHAAFLFDLHTLPDLWARASHHLSNFALSEQMSIEEFERFKRGLQ